MKNLILTFLALIICHSFQSCSSDDDSGSGSSSEVYYFRFKINGVQKDYKDFVNSSYSTGWNYNDYEIGNGLKETRIGATIDISTNGLYDNLLLDMYLESDLEINHPYRNFGTEAITEPELFVLGYYDEQGTLFYTDHFGWNLTHNGENDAEVIILEITDSSLKGTFEGTLYNASGDYISITEGEFYVSKTKL